MVREQDQGFDFLPVGLLHEVQNVDNVGSDHVAGHVGLLLLPYYSTNQRPEPLCDAERGKLVVD